MSNANKMDTNAVFEMFEAISKKLDKRTDTPTEPVQTDLSAVDILTEKLEIAIEEVCKPAKVEHHHRHTIDVNSSKVFLSLIAMFFIIMGLSYAINEQRKTISQYKANDLKYRYIKMQGLTDTENLYRLERQFRYADSIRIIRNQVEKYEELVKQQVEIMERARQNTEKAQSLMKEAQNLKNN
jgi:signal transduction histidine kinase